MNGFTSYKVWSGKTRKDKHVNRYGISERRTPEKNIVWSDLETEVIKKLWMIHLNDSMAAQCREYLMSFLGTNVEFLQQDKPITPTPTFARILESEWAPFIRDLFDTLFILGIVPITFKKTQISENDYVPVVLNRDDYRIQVSYISEIESMVFRVLRPAVHFFDLDKNTTQSSKVPKNHGAGLSFSFMNYMNPFSRMGGMKYSGVSMINKKYKDQFYHGMPENWILDRNSIVLHGFGYDPSIYGQINSRLKTILEYNELTSITGRAMTINLLRQLSSPIFIQNNEPADLSKNKPDVSFTSTIKKKEEANKRRIEEELEAMREIADKYQKMTEHAIMNQDDGFNSEILDQINRESISKLLIGDDVPPISIIPIPKGYILPTGQKADTTLGFRFFDCDENLRERKAAAYGIPIDIILSRGVVRSNTAAQIELLQQTIRRWMNIINEILTHAYNAIYGFEDRKGILAAYLERDLHDKDIIDKIEKHIIDDWIENNGEMTKFKNKELHKKKKTDKKESETTLSDDSSESEAESSKSKSKKRSKRDHESIEKSAKKLKTNEFDPLIQIKTHEPNETESKKHLKNINEVQPVEVKLAISSSLMLDMLAYIYTQGALLDEEYWTALRNRIVYPTDDKILKKLKKKKEIDLGLNDDKKASSSSSSKSGNKDKTSKKKPKPVKEKPQPENVPKVPKLGEDDNRGRTADPEKEKKKKLEGGFKKASETNTKREMSAHSQQTMNAKMGYKNK